MELCHNISMLLNIQLLYDLITTSFDWESQQINETSGSGLLVLDPRFWLRLVKRFDSVRHLPVRFIRSKRCSDCLFRFLGFRWGSLILCTIWAKRRGSRLAGGGDFSQTSQCLPLSLLQNPRGDLPTAITLASDCGFRSSISIPRADSPIVSSLKIWNRQTDFISLLCILSLIFTLSRFSLKRFSISFSSLFTLVASWHFHCSYPILSFPVLTSLPLHSYSSVLSFGFSLQSGYLL